MMIAKLHAQPGSPKARELARARHVLMVAPAGTEMAQLPMGYLLAKALSRRGKKIAELAKDPVSGETPGGALAVWAMPDLKKSAFGPAHWESSVRF